MFVAAARAGSGIGELLLVVFVLGLVSSNTAIALAATVGYLNATRRIRVYAAVAQGVWVFDPQGRLLGILAVPARPANLAWCDRDARGLAITAVDAVYYVRLRVQGLMPGSW